MKVEFDSMALGVYISVPFCRSKCSFCNFASGVFSRDQMDRYIDQVSHEIFRAEVFAESIGVTFERSVDSIYVGGGTPTTLAPQQIRDVFTCIHSYFDVQQDAEITIECAPGTLSPEILDALLEAGASRVSLGAQSFVDEEIRSVGRLRTARQTTTEIERLIKAGITNINIDLIAGLPHQTRASWRHSLDQVKQSGVPHTSVYILEVDEESRLGRELIAGGSRYHAHYVPDSDLAADLYLEAVERLEDSGVQQYEISNFARPGFESRHNLKYWTRKPYLGFGLDAHSMLFAKNASSEFESVRFGNTDDLTSYLAGLNRPSVTPITRQEAVEEQMFLGLRLNRGIDVAEIPPEMFRSFEAEIQTLIDLKLLERSGDRLRLTSRGRLLSNEVFERFIAAETFA